MIFVVIQDDGDHSTELEEFTSLEEATKYFVNEVKTAKKDLEEYFGSSPSDWEEDCLPHIEVAKISEEEGTETINCWVPDPDGGEGEFDIPVN